MNDIIKDFHELTEIPVFQEMVPDKKYMDTEEHLDVLQMNIGRKCNLLCKHCHVNAGPARTEEMSKEVMDACLTFAKEQNIATIDITGGAPEMNPHLEYLIEESSRICNHVIIRTNLVILLEEEYEQLMEVYTKNKVEIVCSLPYYRAAEMDKVRGEGSFDKAIEVIKHLNAIGYGRNPELVLNMVYNPAGAFFPPDQEAMEKEYKQKLLQDFGIEFNSLYTLYNNPNTVRLAALYNANKSYVSGFQNTPNKWTRFFHVDFNANTNSIELGFYQSDSDQVGGYIRGVTDIYFTSDKRYKKNIKSYIVPKGLLDVKLKSYIHKDTEEHKIGYIAQEVQEIAPDFIQEDKNGYLSIAYRELELALIEALKQEVKQLRKELNQLKAQTKKNRL